MFRSLLLAAALLAGTAQAESAECRNAMDQNTMNRCADDEYRAADKALNASYGKLMAALDGKAFKSKLKIAQRAWIAFRDGECTFETAENEGGSIHPMVYSGCLTRLTKARAKELDGLLACQKNAEKCGM
jgi:uncharacterized protein YecT (DUF1311 family)